MDTLWLAVLLKCVSPRWVLRLWVASLVIRVLGDHRHIDLLVPNVADTLVKLVNVI